MRRKDQGGCEPELQQGRRQVNTYSECPVVSGGYWMSASTGDCACGSNHYRPASAWNPNGWVA